MPKYTCTVCGKRFWALDSVHAMYIMQLCKEGKRHRESLAEVKKAK